MAPFGSSGTVSYLTSIATMAVSHTIRLIGQKLSNFLIRPVFGAPVRGEAIRVKQQPSVMKN